MPRPTLTDHARAVVFACVVVISWVVVVLLGWLLYQLVLYLSDLVLIG